LTVVREEPEGPNTVEQIVARYRAHAGLRAKSSLALVAEVLGPTDWVAGPGDDAAAFPEGDRGFLLAAGEAIWPPFVETDPYGAGVAAVVANVNDVAAMGGWVLGLVDTVVGPEPLARRVLEGMRAASELYGVAIVGGHLTVRDGPPAVSAFAIGRARALLSAANAAPGQVLLLAAALEGHLRKDPPIFSSIVERADRLAADVAVLPAVAASGLCVAAKDVSMAGLLGSLAMLLEPSGAGATVELDRVPIPEAVSLADWTDAFPSFGFLLCATPERAEACAAAFRDRGLACEPVGTLDATGVLRVRLGGREATLARPAVEGVTGLGRSAQGAPDDASPG
jgi:selenophosphate synthetase-related protein